MKKLVLLSSVVFLLAACSDKSDEGGASKIDSSSKVAKESKSSTEKSGSKESNSTSKSEPKESETKKEKSKNVSKSNVKSEIDILSDEFRQDYMFNDHRFGLGEIKFGMTRNEVQSIYGTPSGNVPKEIASPDTAAVYGNYLVTYGPKDEVRQIAVVADKPISKSEFLNLYESPTEDNNKFLTYNTNDNNGFKISVSFDNNDNLIGLYQTNDLKGMKDSGGDAYDEAVAKSFKASMYDYAKENNKAASSNYFDHAPAPREDFYAITEDGMMLMQSLMNPGQNVYDISAKTGVVVYDAKSGVTGEDEDSNKLFGYESLNKLIKSVTSYTVYILADNGKVYEYSADQSKFIEGYFGMVMPSWGLNYKTLPVLKETQNQKVSQIGKDSL